MYVLLFIIHYISPITESFILTKNFFSVMPQVVKRVQYLFIEELDATDINYLICSTGSS